MNIEHLDKTEERQTRLAYMWLNHFRTMGPNDRMKLFEIFGTPLEVMDSLYKDEQVLSKLVDAEIIKVETKEEILSNDIDRWYSWVNANMDRTGIKCVTPEESLYPERLYELPDRPISIYYRGDITIANETAAVGIVGSRRPTSYGVMEAEQFSTDLASRGVVVVSGMAYGIDSKAHRGAMDVEGKTIAVLGGGVDICYPRTNMDIYFEMCEKQLVLSEYEPEVEHISIHFPQRNRIISGLSDGVLLVEAALQSGTMITADRALEQGRTVYGIPGRATDVNSRGIHRLIKQGAMLVDSPLDIVDDLCQNGILKTKRKPRRKKSTEGSAKASTTFIWNADTSDEEKESQEVITINGASVSRGKNTRKIPLTKEEENIRKKLGYEPIHIDDLIRQNGMQISQTIHILKSLELKGAVKCIEKSYYILR